MNKSDHECFKCGSAIKPHTSAYHPWDEVFVLNWIPASDSEYVTETESGGTHPDTVTRRFCSRDCLGAYIQMDYSLKPRSMDTPE